MNPTASNAQVNGVLKHSCLDRLVAAHTAHPVPFLIMCGSADVFIDPKRSDTLAAALKSEVYVFKNAGHQLNDECAQQVSDYIIQHVNSAEKVK